MQTAPNIDNNGVEINVGDRVQLAGWPYVGIEFKLHPIISFDDKPLSREGAYGTITKISDPDGDVDDEGRSIAIPPKVTVEFDDGVVDEFSGHWLGRFQDDETFEYEDIERLENRDHNNERGIDPIEMYVDVLCGLRKGRLDDHSGSVFDKRSPLTHQSIRQVDADGNPYLDYN